MKKELTKETLEVKMTCSCGKVMKVSEMEYIGETIGIDKMDFDLAFFNCPFCHSTRTVRIMKVKGVN